MRNANMESREESVQCYQVKRIFQIITSSMSPLRGLIGCCIICRYKYVTPSGFKKQTSKAFNIYNNNKFTQIKPRRGGIFIEIKDRRIIKPRRGEICNIVMSRKILNLTALPQPLKRRGLFEFFDFAWNGNRMIRNKFT